MEKWIRFLRPYAVAAIGGVLMAMMWPVSESVKIVEASPVKNWTSNEYIRYSDLNAVVNHLHANLGHGHGAIITANDIATNAGIRPEQTTFGLSVNRALVHTGTYTLNPDAGVAYVPVNAGGELDVTVNATAEGYTVTGVAAAGALSDGGVGIYTVISQGIGVGYATVNGATTNRYNICWSIANAPTFASPLSLAYRCQDIGTAITTPTPVNPLFVAVEIYSNKVQ